MDAGRASIPAGELWRSEFGRSVWRPYLRPTRSYLLAAAEISRLIELLGSMPIEGRKQLPGMEPGRADVLLAGAVILERVMKYFGCGEVLVSDQGVRWGLMWREVERKSRPISSE